MALKGDRLVLQTDITKICNVVAEKGQFLSYSTTGSGSAISDDKAGIVQLHATGSGAVVVGCLLANFVSIDQTRQHRNFHRDEQVIGEKAPLLKKGWVTTNKVVGTPTVGQNAYLTASGAVTATNAGASFPRVGTFDSILDEDGFIRLEVNLPY